MQNANERHFRRATWKAALLAVLVLFVVRCDLTEPVDRQSLVVEAFLKTGESPPAILLRETQALNVGAGRPASRVRGAEVQLEVGGEVVPYRASEETPGRYVPANEEDAVPTRSPWALSVGWEGTLATARGVTPPPIALAELCVEVPDEPVRAILVDSLRRDSLDIPAEQGYIYPVDVSLQWASSRLGIQADTTHWVRPRVRPDTTESSSRVVNFFLEPVDVRREDRFQLRGGDRFWRGVYAIPVEDSTASAPRHTLTATVVRGDTSFAAFARSRNDPERREPISNVDGGLGIATAVAVDSLRRTIAAGTKECYAAGPARP